jgi:hypothetical protein
VGRHGSEAISVPGSEEDFPACRVERSGRVELSRMRGARYVDVDDDVRVEWSLRPSPLPSPVERDESSECVRREKRELKTCCCNLSLPSFS